MLLGDTQGNFYSQLFTLLSSDKKINLEPHPIPPHNLGTPSFEQNCIIEEIDVVIFCGKEYSDETKKSFAKENATKPIMVVLPDEAVTLHLQEGEKFSETIIALHNKHIGRRPVPKS